MSRRDRQHQHEAAVLAWGLKHIGVAMTSTTPIAPADRLASIGALAAYCRLLMSVQE